MSEANVQSPLTRAMIVALYSAAAYIFFGLVIYAVQLMLVGFVDQRDLVQQFIVFDILIYTFFAIHVLASALMVRALIRSNGAPVFPTLTMTIAMFVTAVYPTLVLVSFANTCQTGLSFPISGSSC